MNEKIKRSISFALEQFTILVVMCRGTCRLPGARRNKLVWTKAEEEALKVDLLSCRLNFSFLFLHVFISNHFDCMFVDHWLILRAVFFHTGRYGEICDGQNQWNPVETHMGTWERDF